MTQIGAVLFATLGLALHAAPAAAQALPNIRTITSCSIRAFPQDPAAPNCVPSGSCVTNNVIALPPAAPASLSGDFGSFDFSCSASVELTGPTARAGTTLVEIEPGVGDIALSNGYAEVQYYVRFSGTGAPGNIPITVDTLLMTSLGSTDAIARFDMTVANLQKLTAQVRMVGGGSCSFFVEDETRFEGGLLPGGVCDLDLTGPTALRGDAEPGTAYLITLKATAETGAAGGISAMADPVILVDPDAEFSPGQRYADHYQVELSEGVVQLPEPSSFLSRGFALACLVLLRRRRN